MTIHHKYGFHVNRTGEDVFQSIQRLKPRVIKSLEHDVGFWRRVRQIHPDAFLIGRLFVPAQEQDHFVRDPKGIGRGFAERILALEANQAEFNGKPLFDAWESYNEIMPGHASGDLKRRYDEFQVAFGERLKAGGFEPVAMNFATGNMRGKDFLEYFAGTLETHRYLGFHEYDWPDMWRLHKENIEEKNEGGMWLTLRYRRTMALEGVRARYGNQHTVIITECGMTQGVQGRDDVGPWHESHPISPERYWRSLLWYNHELMQDPYVLAACLFVVGAVTPWHSFEHLGDIMDRLDQLNRRGPDQPIPQPVAGTPAPVPTPPVEPDPAPIVDPGQPGVELHRVLLAAGEANQVIQFNPNAALQKRIFADGFVPNSPEFDLTHRGAAYVCQRAEHLSSGAVRVYYVEKGKWDRVMIAERGARITSSAESARPT